jgi:hypothetical protein
VEYVAVFLTSSTKTVFQVGYCDRFHRASFSWMTNVCNPALLTVAAGGSFPLH